MFSIFLVVSWKMLSWEKSRFNIFRLQKRIFKSVWIGDLKMALRLQKLLLSSNSSRLVAIKLVTQKSLQNNVSGIDGKVSLTFAERFQLNNFIKKSFNSWYPERLKEVLLSKRDGNSVSYKISTIADRTWLLLVKFAIEPAHEVNFSPRSFGFRNRYLIHDLQKVIFLNLCKSSFGFQKRILKFSFVKNLESFDQSLLLRRILAPRAIKIGIFRFFKIGFCPSFSESFFTFVGFDSLLANILVNGVESVHNMVRYGSYLLLFLCPMDDENVLVNKLVSFLSNLSIIKDFNVNLFTSFSGFDFLGWHFKVHTNTYLYCSPSKISYNSLLARVKHIINNSNYGANVKSLKISPIIKEWRIYNRFCNLKDSKFSLFYLQKRAFSVFNKESSQDRYSIKKLLENSFSSVGKFENKIDSYDFFSYSFHIGFWCYKNNNPNFYLGYLQIGFSEKNYCLYCGRLLSGFF